MSQSRLEPTADKSPVTPVVTPIVAEASKTPELPTADLGPAKSAHVAVSVPSKPLPAEVIEEIRITQTTINVVIKAELTPTLEGPAAKQAPSMLPSSENKALLTNTPSLTKTTLNTVLNQPFSQNHQDVIKGFTIGSLTELGMYYPNRIVFLSRVAEAKNSGLRDVAAQLYTKPFTGLVTSVIRSGAQLATIYASQGEFKKIFDSVYQHPLNESLSTGFAAAATKMLFFPLAVVEARRFSSQKYAIIRDLPFKNFYKGAPITALRDGFNFPIYLGLIKTISPHLKEWGMEENLVAYTSGCIAGVATSSLTYPLNTIADVQKLHGGNIVSTAKTLFQQGGAGRLYQGYGSSLFPAVTFGIGFSAAKKFVNGIYTDAENAREHSSKLKC